MNRTYHARLDFVLEALATASGESRSLLDVGFVGDFSRYGFHYAVVDALRPGDRMVGIDIDGPEVERFLQSEETRRRRERMDLRYEVMSITETSFDDGAFDVVLLLEVFEHLKTPYAVFDEIRRILKPGGTLIMTYPNPLGLNTLVKFILQKDLLDGRYIRGFKGNPSHLVYPHPVCLAIYLMESGFDVRRIGFLKFAFPRLKWLQRFLGWFIVTRRFSADIGVHAVRRGPTA